LAILLSKSHLGSSFVNTRMTFFDISFNRRTTATEGTTKTLRYLSQTTSASSCIYYSELREKSDSQFTNLFNCLAPNSPQLLYLSNSKLSNERGVYANDSIPKGGIICSIPLSSCIRDDAPPNWYKFEVDSHSNPSEWAARLAASLLDFQINAGSVDVDTQTSKSEDMYLGRKQWLSMMPDSDYLRKILPIHWPEQIVSNAKCTALELSVDTSFFVRAETVEDLLVSMKQSGLFAKYDDADLRSKCHDALDLVQTRSCRVEKQGAVQLRPQLRVIAPIFDFINYGSSLHNREGSANAQFGLEGPSEESLDYENNILVVRARRNIQKDEEVLIDYGDCSRPAWRCLANYGFLTDEEENESAELFLDGIPYEVRSDSIPFEIVEAATHSLLEEERGATAFTPDDEIKLSPEVALQISKRASDAAFHLLQEPNMNLQESIDKQNSSGKEASFESFLPAKLAASLRSRQAQALRECSVGLQDFAAQ